MKSPEDLERAFDDLDHKYRKLKADRKFLMDTYDGILTLLRGLSSWLCEKTTVERSTPTGSEDVSPMGGKVDQ